MGSSVADWTDDFKSLVPMVNGGGTGRKTQGLLLFEFFEDNFLPGEKPK